MRSIGGEILAMYVLENHLLHVLAFPLRGHVPDAVHREEREVLLELNEVPGNLVVRGPHCPFLGDGPLQGLNPATCPNGGNHTIGVSRIVHQSVIVALEDSINPDGGLH